MLPTAPASTNIAFRVVGPDLAGTWISVGLFPGAIPQGRPVADVILIAPGTYRGWRRCPVAATTSWPLPCSEDPLKSLLPGVELRVGRSWDPLVVRDGGTVGQVEVEMCPPRTTDPPVLIALPALLLKIFST